MPRVRMDSFMNNGTSELQWGHWTRSEGAGGTARSLSQCRHLKCIMGVMKPLLVMLLLAISVEAQAIVDAARQERARQARLKSTITIKETGTPAPPQTEKAAGAEKLEKPPAPDPVEVWNGKMDQLRKEIRDLQDQDVALQLQKTQLQNQVYATVVDPAAKDQ